MTRPPFGAGANATASRIDAVPPSHFAAAFYLFVDYLNRKDVAAAAGRDHRRLVDGGEMLALLTEVLDTEAVTAGFLLARVVAFLRLLEADAAIRDAALQPDLAGFRMRPAPLAVAAQLDLVVEGTGRTALFDARAFRNALEAPQDP